MIQKNILILLLILSGSNVIAQSGSIKGKVFSDGKPVEFASVGIASVGKGVATDNKGAFMIKDISFGKYIMEVRAVGFISIKKNIDIRSEIPYEINIDLQPTDQSLNEVVVTGTMKEVSRSASPIPVEIITPKLFQKNPTPSLFEAIGMVNGVQPQLNCNVCNTGDIHINGMEGPYTMILIDGMPIVSSLATVYGLSGIPNSIVERIEVVKGPASSLYGSESMGGVINVITKNPAKAPLLSFDVFGTTWGEYSADLSTAYKIKKVNGLLGVNYFNYQNRIDKNKDGFTDLTLQDRVSVFNKWSIERKENRVASLAARYVYEDRWGGQTSWNKLWRGSDSVYGESIFTNRVELIGMYQLPVTEKIMTQFSFNDHRQNSYYGFIPYMASQQVYFAQAYWDKKLVNRNNLLAGATVRYTFYDDNTPGTQSADTVNPLNQPSETMLPGLFVQDEWSVTDKHTLLGGYRYDYHQQHGNIHSPRVAYKFSPDNNNTLRASFGTGFRVVNLFTEDHAALTGAREVVITRSLQPEKSYNSNLNYVRKLNINRKYFFNFDATAFYSYFTNKIVGDFDADPNKIIYDNLNGHAISQGISLNTDISFPGPLKISLGATFMDVFLMREDSNSTLQRTTQLHAPKWSGTFVVSYIFKHNIVADFTGKWAGPMRLPVLPNDYRPEYSPWFAILNIQLTKKFNNGFDVYSGVKNLLNFVPENPIMRAFDPFDKTASNTVTNPNGYTFDPSYNYSSLQGIRFFLGIRYNLIRS